jgi:hypothetical protein
MNDKAYRYNESLTELGVYVYLTDYKVVKETPKGIWIELWIGKNKFVNLQAKKKFACLTIEEALESFKKRKQRQITILEYQLANAKQALFKAEVLRSKDERYLI